MRATHLWRFLPVASWIGVAATGLWCFISLYSAEDPSGEAVVKSAFDQAFVFLFLLLVPIGLWLAYKAFLDAKAEIPLADAKAEQIRLQRLRQKEAHRNVANQPPLHEETKQEVLDILAHLKAAGVIAESEIDECTLLQICRSQFVESGDETASILALYSETHGDFANALFSIEYTEKSEASIRYMIEGFARLAGQAEALSDVCVLVTNSKPGRAQYTIFGERLEIEFEQHAKHTSQSLMTALATAFNPEPPYALAYFEPVFIITTLGDSELTALNQKLDPQHDTFERVTTSTLSER